MHCLVTRTEVPVEDTGRPMAVGTWKQIATTPRNWRMLE